MQQTEHLARVFAALTPDQLKGLHVTTPSADDRHAMLRSRAIARKAAPSTPKRVPSPLATEPEADADPGGACSVRANGFFGALNCYTRRLTLSASATLRVITKNATKESKSI